MPKLTPRLNAHVELEPVDMPAFLKEGPLDPDAAMAQVDQATRDLRAPTTDTAAQLTQAVDNAIANGPEARVDPVCTVMKNSTVNTLTSQEKTLMGVEDELIRRSSQLIAEIGDCRDALVVVRSALQQLS